MKKNFKYFVLTILICTLFLTACSGGDSPTDSEGAIDNEIKIAMVLGEGGLGDLGFNDEAFEGLLKAAEDFGISYDYVEPKSVNDFEPQLRMFAESGEYDLVIAVGATQVDAVKLVASEFPDQRFSIIDVAVEGYDNIHSSSARNPEQHFLSGVLSGLVTLDDRLPYTNEENILAFAISIDAPIPREAAAGFMAGAKYVNPDVEIIYNFIGGYRDPEKAKEIALTAFDRGADIITHNAGASGLGVIEAARERGKYVIGTSRQSADVDYSLAVSVKKTEQMVYKEVESIVKGTWQAGSSVYGIADDVCDYDISGLKVEIPEDILEIVEDIKQEIIDGKLELPYKIEDVDEWAARNQYKK
ncbi:MAG: BMP family ABC transporter substrate-binding protein [Tissierellia bacterium]|nr:BMP family ABC transporter substrate-binding protein [Tissierellia bacterium]